MLSRCALDGCISAESDFSVSIIQVTLFAILQAATEAVEVAVTKQRDAEEALEKERQVQEECGAELPAEADRLTTDGPMQPFYKARQQCSEALQLSEQHLEQCKQDLMKAQSNCKVKWTKLRLYWTKGLPWTASELRDLHLAGLPLVAAMLLKTSADGSDQTAEPGTEPRPYDALAKEQQIVSWDDELLSIATVPVVTGADGDCFVKRELYADAEGAGVVEGFHEMAGALQRLEEAALAYQDWKAQSKLMQLPDVPVNLSIYRSLMNSVPAEQQSVATVMHCLLEEAVCAVDSVEDEDSLHDAWEVQQAKRYVEGALQNSAAASLLRTDPDGEVAHFSSVVEGDEPMMRSHGLLSGLVKRPGAGMQSSI